MTLYKSIQNQEESLINHCLGQIYAWNRNYKNKLTWKDKFHIVSFLYGSSIGLFKRICHVSSNRKLAFRWWREEVDTGTTARPWGLCSHEMGLVLLQDRLSENCLNLPLFPSCEDTLCPPTLSGCGDIPKQVCSPDSNLLVPWTRTSPTPEPQE